MAVWGAIGRGAARGAKWGAAGAVGGGLGLGVNPLLGLAVGNAIRNMKGFGKRDTTITAGEKPHPESKKNPKVKGDLSKTVDFQSAILQIDKTTRATYLQTLKNNHEIIHIQKMLAGPTAARAKELRMESSLGGGPIIINNIVGGGEKKEDGGFPWWIPMLAGTVAAIVLGDPFMGKSRWTKTKTTLKTVEEKLTKTLNDRLKAVEDRLKIAEEARRTRANALNERLKAIETRIKIGEYTRFGRASTLSEDRLRFSDAMRESESRIRERLNELYRARESSWRTELIEDRGRTRGSRGTAASVFENIRNDIKLLKDSIYRSRTGPTGKLSVLDQLRSISERLGEGKTGRESIADAVRSLKDSIYQSRTGPTGKLTILERLALIDGKMGVNPGSSLVEVFDLGRQLTETRVDIAAAEGRIGRSTISLDLIRLPARVASRIGETKGIDRRAASRALTRIYADSGMTQKMGKLPPTVRIGVDGKRVSSGAVPYTEAELNKLSAGDAQRLQAAQARMTVTTTPSKGRIINLPGTEYAELGEGGASEAKVAKATANVKSKFGGGYTFNIGPSRWGNWKINASPTKIISFLRNAFSTGKVAQAMPRGLGKAIFIGFAAWIVGIFIWNTVRLIFGEYGPLGDPATNTAYLNDQKILAAQIVAAGLTWWFVGKGLELLVGIVLTSGIKGASIVGGPLGVALGFILNFVLTGIIVHKMTPMLIRMLEKFGWVPAGTFLSYEEMKAAEKVANDARKAAIKAREGVASEHMKASGLGSALSKISAGDFSMYSWNMGTRRGAQIAAAYAADKYPTTGAASAAAAHATSKGQGYNVISPTGGGTQQAGMFSGLTGLWKKFTGGGSTSTTKPSRLGSMNMLYNERTSRSDEEFYGKALRWLERHLPAGYKHLAKVGAAQASLESAFGTSAYAHDHYNFFGMNYKPLWADTKKPRHRAFFENISDGKKQKWGKFKSWEESAKDWIGLMTRPGLKYANPVKGNVGNLSPEDAAIAISQQGYGGSDRYGKKLQGIMSSVGTRVDNKSSGSTVGDPNFGKWVSGPRGMGRKWVAFDQSAANTAARQQALMAQSGGTDTNVAGSNGATIVNYTDYGDNFTTQATTNFHPWKSHLGIPNQAIAY